MRTLGDFKLSDTGVINVYQKGHNCCNRLLSYYTNNYYHETIGGMSYSG